MSQLQTRQMPKGYAILWGVITLVYMLWMTFPMRTIVLQNYETPEERTVDGYLYTDITGFVGHHWLYPIWVIVSAGTLLLFIVYIKKLLYAEQLSNIAKWLCLIGCVVGCVYVVAFGFLDAPNREGEIASFSDKLRYVTASMIGLVWPKLFKLWGVLGGATLFANTMYAYRKFEFESKTGVILGSLGAAAIYMTINCPSYGETKDFSVPRCAAHWSGALLFAVLIAAPLVIFLFRKAKEEKGIFLWTFVIVVILLLTMVILLITVGKSAMIENIPMIAGYILVYLLNFTHIYDKKELPE